MRTPHDPIQLTVLGAGPAYSDRPGAIGAAYLVRHGDTQLVLDLGHGTFSQLASTVEPSTLDGLVVSHLHPDHFVDLVPMRHYLRWEFEPGRRLRVIGPRDLANRLDLLHAQPGFSEASLDTEPLSETQFRVGSISIEARKVFHTDDSYAFRLTVDDGGPALVYSGDCGRATDLDPLIRPGDILLCEASNGPGPGAPEAAHLDGPSVGALAARTGARRVLLTHLQMNHDRDATVESVCREYTGPVELVDPGFEATIE
jgi:ribonuclease BN (tRNA processing enzyme)